MAGFIRVIRAPGSLRVRAQASGESNSTGSLLQTRPRNNGHPRRIFGSLKCADPVPAADNRFDPYPPHVPVIHPATQQDGVGPWRAGAGAVVVQVHPRIDRSLATKVEAEVQMRAGCNGVARVAHGTDGITGLNPLTRFHELSVEMGVVAAHPHRLVQHPDDLAADRGFLNSTHSPWASCQHRRSPGREDVDSVMLAPSPIPSLSEEGEDTAGRATLNREGQGWLPTEG